MPQPGSTLEVKVVVKTPPANNANKPVRTVKTENIIPNTDTFPITTADQMMNGANREWYPNALSMRTRTGPYPVWPEC